MILFCTFLITGIIIGNSYNSITITVASTVMLLLLLVLIYIKIRGFIFLLIGIVVFYSVGSFGYINIKRTTYEKFSGYDGCEVEIVGTVKSYPDTKVSTVSYVVDVESIKANSLTHKIKGKVLLSVLSNDNPDILDYGRRLSIKGEITLPKGRRNPGGFDYRAYLAGNGVSATVFANQTDIELHSGLGSNFLESSGLKIRNEIIETINNSLPAEHAGLLNGMLIGYREGLDQRVQADFSNAGLSHLMAVSGSNIAFIILPLVFIFKRIGIRSRSSSLLIIGILVLFVYITGFEPSVLRAVIMAVIILMGRVIAREADILTSISFAAIVMLINNPFTLFNIGFQLSFAATLSLVLFYKNIKEMINYRFIPEVIVDVLAATLAAQIGVLPISVYYFNQVSLISVFSNILVVPVTQFVTILGFMMALAGQISLVLAQILGYVNCALLSFILFVTRVTAEVPFAVIRVATPSIMMIIVYYVSILLFLWYKPIYMPNIRAEYYIYATALIVGIFLLPGLMPKGLEVVFLDVGQGDAIFIRTASGRTILVDGGGFTSRRNRDSTAGDMVIIPFLYDHGVTKLDMVVATHGHDDHVQGLISVLREIKVANIIIPDNPGNEKEFKVLLSEVQKRKISVESCKRGDVIYIDKSTKFEVLHPKKEYNVTNSTLNNGSIVLKLDYKDIEILLTGDIEEEVERLLIEDGVDLQSDIIKVAHHGSSTSSSEEFLSAANAKAAIISVGKNNFGHPAPEVVDRIENNQLSLYRTDRDGGIVLKSNGKNIKILKTVTVEK